MSADISGGKGKNPPSSGEKFSEKEERADRSYRAAGMVQREGEAIYPPLEGSVSLRRVLTNKKRGPHPKKKSPFTGRRHVRGRSKKGD